MAMTVNQEGIAETLKSWLMVVVTLLFVMLYGAALAGWLKPLADAAIVTRLESIVFVFIGYYFGHLPTQQRVKTLREEINGQTQKANAAQHAKEQALQSREALEEKLKNVRTALLPIVTKASGSGTVEPHADSSPAKDDALRHTVNIIMKILDA
jgi:hypothetical protein